MRAETGVALQLYPCAWGEHLPYRAATRFVLFRRFAYREVPNCHAKRHPSTKVYPGVVGRCNIPYSNTQSISLGFLPLSKERTVPYYHMDLGHSRTLIAVIR